MQNIYIYWKSTIFVISLGSTDNIASPPSQTTHSLVESAALQSAAKQTHVELKEVEVVTGEEGESNVFQVIWHHGYVISIAYIDNIEVFEMGFQVIYHV